MCKGLELTQLQIKDFKCFKDFEAEGFKRVNLICGKNNVGKTVFMEACCINVSSKRTINTSFIDNFGLDNKYLKEAFISVQQKDKEENFYNYINEFDSNILNIKILGRDNPTCKVINRDEYQNINEFGDGLKHYISIICSLYACENGYLFIDEIDNGIHYTQLDRLWEIILTVSKEQNVQVFATTHSKECIESYARVSKKLEDEDIAFIELGRDKKNELKAMVYPYDWFEDEVSQNHELRGW